MDATALLEKPRAKKSAGRHYPISVEMYHLMGERGVFPPDARVELLDGEIFEMSPVGSLHVRCVNFLNEFFVGALAGKYLVSIQNPFILSKYGEPQPDLTILERPADLYKTALPKSSDVVIVIEVSDSTARFDRNRKLPAYAKAGVPEAWIIDLRAEQVEIHTEPTAKGYNAVKICRKGDHAISESVPAVVLLVDDILG